MNSNTPFCFTHIFYFALYFLLYLVYASGNVVKCMNSVITYACVCVGMRVGFAVSRQTPEKDGYDVRWLLLVLPQFDPPLPLLLSPVLLPRPTFLHRLTCALCWRVWFCRLWPCKHYRPTTANFPASPSPSCCPRLLVFPARSLTVIQACINKTPGAVAEWPPHTEDGDLSLGAVILWRSL